MAGDDNRNGSYLGMPLALWFAIITAISTVTTTVSNSWMQNRNHEILESNAKQQQKQSTEVAKKLDGIKAEATKTAVSSDKTATAAEAIPAATIKAAKKLVDDKVNSPDVTVNEKLEALAEMGAETHSLVNSAMGNVLRMLAEVSRAKANDSKSKSDIDAAVAAEKAYKDHQGGQARVDAKINQE